MKKNLVLLGIVSLAILGCQPNNKKLNLKEVNTIITHGIIVTVDSVSSLYPDGAIAIDGDEIIAIGTSAEISGKYRSENVIDAKGKIVMPGMINCHTHLSMTLFRGLADDLQLQDWLTK